MYHLDVRMDGYAKNKAEFVPTNSCCVTGVGGLPQLRPANCRFFDILPEIIRLCVAQRVAGAIDEHHQRVAPCG